MTENESDPPDDDREVPVLRAGVDEEVRREPEDGQRLARVVDEVDPQVLLQLAEEALARRGLAHRGARRRAEEAPGVTRRRLRRRRIGDAAGHGRLPEPVVLGHVARDPRRVSGHDLRRHPAVLVLVEARQDLGQRQDLDLDRVHHPGPADIDPRRRERVRVRHRRQRRTKRRPWRRARQGPEAPEERKEGHEEHPGSVPQAGRRDKLGSIPTRALAEADPRVGTSGPGTRPCRAPTTLHLRPRP